MELWTVINEIIVTTHETMLLNIRVLMLLLILLGYMLIILVCYLFISYLIIKLVMHFVPCGAAGKVHVAFFHPYCNAGGGGERVLWTAIQAIQTRYPHVECYVYTGDTDVTPHEIMENVRLRFNIQLQKTPNFVYLHLRKMVEARYYPFFTLLMQSLGSVFLGAEALFKFRPSIYIDTMGYAFTYPLFRYVGGCSVACYTHYPTISSDMLDRVSNRTEAHNNRAFISQSSIFSLVKLCYYHMFAFFYGYVGCCSHVVMVNSSWTKSHIASLWKYGVEVKTVFPPCDVSRFSSLSFVRDEEKAIKSIVSIGQFRPEKDYPLQLQSFHKLLEEVDQEVAAKLRLVLIGGVRNKEDEERVEFLKSMAVDLKVEDKVIWKVNATFNELLQEVQKGTVGIHTMWNEHFGIGVVESMAGGLIMVAHDSGGPKLDIVTSYNNKITGFLANSVESYVQKIQHILSLSSKDKLEIRGTARNSTERFSDQTFQSNFISCLNLLLDPSNSE